MTQPHTALNGRRVLVTGATGFIGANLVRALVEAECRVAVLVRPGADAWRLREVIDRVEVIDADLRDRGAVERIEVVCAADVVFHLAAVGTTHEGDHLESLVHDNLQLARHAVRLAARGGAARMVYVGSCAEYGTGIDLTEEVPLAPASPYGIAKAATWMALRVWAREAGCMAVCLRVFSPFGPFEEPSRLIPHVIISALEGRPPRLTPGQQIRDFIYVGDVVDALLRAATAPDVRRNVLNICTGRETRVIDLVAQILKLMGHSSDIRSGALAYRPGEPMQVSGDPGLAAAQLGWTPRTPLETALRRTIEWWTRRGAADATMQSAGKR